MAYFLFSRRGTFPHTTQDHLPSKIRLSIFLIAGECGGLPALVWALRVLYGHHKSGGRISVLVIVLLLSDLLVLLLNPYIVTTLWKDENCWETSRSCRAFTFLWSGSVIYGLHLHQVVALEGTLSLRHPHCSTHAFFPLYSTLISIITLICFLSKELCNATIVIVLNLPFILAIMLTFCIVTCGAPPHINNILYATKKPRSAVLAFVMITMILHVFVIMCIITGGPWGLWEIGVSLMSLRVTLDPLLCVLACRKNLRVQTPQTHVEHNTDIELTQIQSSDTPKHTRSSDLTQQLQQSL